MFRNAASVVYKSLVAISAGITLLASQNASAVVVTVDGDTSDLSAAVLSLPYNVGSVTDPNNDGENNGFDITDAYAHYDVATDTFYLGMNFFGQVGTSGGLEETCPSPFICPEPGLAGVFDANETYGFNIIRDSDTTTLVDLRLSGDSGGGENISSEINPFLSARSWSVSEANNGVEFSVTGLGAAGALGNFGFTNPTDVTIGFFAGSISNTALEDEAFVNMQVVPVPAAVWLFVSGLFALVNFARRSERS